MANKNTIRKNRAARRNRKRGFAVNSENGGKFNPKLDAQMVKQVNRIREQSRKLYGVSA